MASMTYTFNPSQMPIIGWVCENCIFTYGRCENLSAAVNRDRTTSVDRTYHPINIEGRSRGLFACHGARCEEL